MSPFHAPNPPGGPLKLPVTTARTSVPPLKSAGGPVREPSMQPPAQAGHVVSGKGGRAPWAYRIQGSAARNSQFGSCDLWWGADARVRTRGVDLWGQTCVMRGVCVRGV